MKFPHLLATFIFTCVSFTAEGTRAGTFESEANKVHYVTVLTSERLESSGKWKDKEESPGPALSDINKSAMAVASPIIDKSFHLQRIILQMKGDEYGYYIVQYDKERPAMAQTTERVQIIVLLTGEALPIRLPDESDRNYVTPDVMKSMKKDP